MDSKFSKELVVVRGAGDLATAVITKLHEAGFPVVALETEQPTAIRRTVALSEALKKGVQRVENTEGVACESLSQVKSVLGAGKVPVVADPRGNLIEELRPKAVVDAILAKRNLGTNKEMAEIVIALGPGFEAGKDCGAVIETQRGHNLGRIYYEGCAAPNTGVPGNIGGYTIERVVHSPAQGTVAESLPIGSIVEEGQTIAVIKGEDGEETPVKAKIGGVLRGMIADGTVVPKGLKIADVDPRGIVEYCQTVSDKGRNIAGGVLEALLHLL